MPERRARTATGAPRPLPILAAVVSFAFLSLSAVPHASSLSLADPGASRSADSAQEFTGESRAVLAAARAGYDVTDPPRHSAPRAGSPDAGTAQAIAYEMVLARGWDESEYSCLVALWTRESNWRVTAENPRSGAYGIPQAFPGEKMASAGDDWRSSPATQITWGLGYIEGRYGTPCGAWQSSQARGWY